MFYTNELYINDNIMRISFMVIRNRRRGSKLYGPSVRVVVQGRGVEGTWSESAFRRRAGARGRFHTRSLLLRPFTHSAPRVRYLSYSRYNISFTATLFFASIMCNTPCPTDNAPYKIILFLPSSVLRKCNADVFEIIF